MLTRTRYLLAAFLILGCDAGIRTLEPGNLAGEYYLTMANGFFVPHEGFVSGTLSVKSDSTYTLFLNGELAQSGRWRARDKSFTATASSGACAPFFVSAPQSIPTWCIWNGVLEAQAIRLLPDAAHSNWYVFHVQD